jgi:hypothetical protein
MKIQKWLVAAILSGIFSTTLLAAGEKLDTARIDELTGLKGKMNEKEGVYKVTFPRDDVKVSVDGWTMPPFMVLGPGRHSQKACTPKRWRWATRFCLKTKPIPLCPLLLRTALEVTALHNHFLFDHPKIYFMHIDGEGTVEQLAGAVRKVYDKIKEIRSASPQLKDSFGRSALRKRTQFQRNRLIKSLE